MLTVDEMTMCNVKRGFMTTHTNVLHTQTSVWSHFLCYFLSHIPLPHANTCIHTHILYTTIAVQRHLHSISRKLSVATACIRDSKVEQQLDICSTSVLKHVCAVREPFNLKDTTCSVSVMVNEVYVQSSQLKGVLNWMKLNMICCFKWTFVARTWFSIMGSFAFGLFCTHWWDALLALKQESSSDLKHLQMSLYINYPAQYYIRA